MKWPAPADSPGHIRLGPRPTTQGEDGLTAEELRRGREDWWDAAFTRALVEAIPEAATRLIEVGCGLGHVARKVLPLTARLSYVGVDLDAARMAETRRDIGQDPVADRVRFVVGNGENLPFREHCADVVLFCMTLQHIASPPDALRESRRALRPGGTLVAAEPDNLSQHWFFGGPLEDVTRAFVAVIKHCRAVRAPADLAIGPCVPDLARAAGFSDVDLRVHAVFATRHESAKACAVRWREMLELFARASQLPEDTPEVCRCREAIEAWLSAGDPERVGQCGTTVPIFLTTAR